jgi:hypothetical protein
MSWTAQKLAEFCNRNNISQDAYSFYKDKDEAFGLDKVGHEWLIYYS